MNDEKSLFTDKWVIPILTSIIASVLLGSAKMFWSGRKSLINNAADGIAKSGFPAIGRYILTVFAGLFSIAVNSYLLYKTLSDPSPVQKGDVLLILLITLSIIYWTADVFKKYQTYSINDFK